MEKLNSWIRQGEKDHKKYSIPISPPKWHPLSIFKTSVSLVTSKYGFALSDGAGGILHGQVSQAILFECQIVRDASYESLTSKRYQTLKLQLSRIDAWF